MGEESEAAVKAVLSGAVATVVFRQAISELPKRVETRQKFLDILAPFTFPGISDVAQVPSDSVLTENSVLSLCYLCGFAE